MKKVRINTTLRTKLENYVRSQIDAGIDKTPLEQAKDRLRHEAVRLLELAYPQPDMLTLAAYGKTDRYAHLQFQMPDGGTKEFDFDEALPYDLPSGHGYRFHQAIAADMAFAAAAQEVEAISTALRAEARRQWEQAAVLVGCALYFEDVLDYLRIPDAERVNLSRRWHLPVEQAQPVIAEDAAATGDDGQETDDSPAQPSHPFLTLIEAVEPVIDYAESEARTLDSLHDGEESAAEAEKAWDLIVTAREAIAREKAKAA